MIPDQQWDGFYNQQTATLTLSNLFLSPKDVSEILNKINELDVVRLHFLDLRIEAVFFDTLIEVLPKAPSLRSLDFEACKFQNVSLQKLSTIPTLRRCSFYATELSEKAMRELCDAVASEFRLSELNLTMSSIPETGLARLATALRINKHLEVLSVGANPGLTAGVLDHFEWALEDNCTLTSLEVSTTANPVELPASISDKLQRNQDLSGNTLAAQGVRFLFYNTRQTGTIQYFSRDEENTPCSDASL